MTRALAWLTGVALWAVPTLVHACPVCFDAKNEAGRVAFLGTTLFLTGLPLLLIGGVIYWLASRSVEDGGAEPGGDERPVLPPEPAPAAREATGSFSTR